MAPKTIQLTRRRQAGLAGVGPGVAALIKPGGNRGKQPI